MLFNKYVVWLFALASLGLVFLDPKLKLTEAYLLMKAGLEVFFLIWCGYLIYSQFENSQKNSQKVIKIRRRSDHYVGMTLNGLIIVASHLLLVYHYDNIFSFNTILIAILFLYFNTQILQNSNPRVLLSKTHLGLSDFKATMIPWKSIKKVSLQSQGLVIHTQNSEKYFKLMGNEDYSDTEFKKELDAQILDGSFSSTGASKTLSQLLEKYAKDQGFDLETSL